MIRALAYKRCVCRLACCIALSFAIVACKKEQPVVYPSQPPTWQPGAAQPGPAPAPPPANTPSAAPAAPAPAPVLPAPAAPAPNAATDPINRVDVVFLRGRAQAILNELVSALDPAQMQRVQGIPLVVDDTVGEVNAFAACTSGGRAAMAITDGLLDIEAHLAQAQAIDELFGTHKVDEYIAFIAKNQRPKQPIAEPPRGFFDAAQAADARKLTRQAEVLDEEIAFVLGHELAHHYLGHLPCTQTGPIPTAEIGHLLSSVVPAFNQPNELAADVAGTNNVLRVGARRTSGYRLTEGGALLTMRFFAGLDRASPVDILFDFERTHPSPLLRQPVIAQTAATFRSTGGALRWPF